MANKTGARIHGLFKEADTTAVKLAAELGISEAVVYKWARGEMLPSGSSLLILCKHFSVSSDWILGLSDDREAVDEGVL